MADIATMTIEIRVRHRRVKAMVQQASGEIKRAARRDRPALMQRWAKRIAETCVILEV